MTKAVAQPKPSEPIRVVRTKAGEVRYKVVLDVSRRNEKRRQVQSTHETLKAARKHVTQVRSDLSRGTFIAPSRVTFKDLADEYLVRVKRGDHGRKPVRPYTLAGYRTALDRMAAHIGARQVDGLTYQDIAAAVDAIAATHSRQSVGLSLTLTRAVLNHGVREQLIPRNIAVGISPKGKPAAKRQAYTVVQIRGLSRAAEGDRLAGVWAVFLLGLRRSEVLALRWSDVDLAAGVLTIARSRVWAAGGYTDNRTKTERGQRRVALDPVTVDRLRAMRKVHAVERLSIGVGLTDDDVLAAHRDGSPIRPEYLAKQWRLLCKRAEVPALGFHAARHGQVKALRAAGLPDGVIAARLGHNETVMRDTYGVPHDSEQQAAAEVMGRLLG